MTHLHTNSYGTRKGDTCEHLSNLILRPLVVVERMPKVVERMPKVESNLARYNLLTSAQKRSHIRADIQREVGGCWSRNDVLAVLNKYSTYITNRTSSYRGLRVFFKSSSKQEKIAAINHLIQHVNDLKPDANLHQSLGGLQAKGGTLVNNRAANQGLLREIIRACIAKTENHHLEGRYPY